MANPQPAPPGEPERTDSEQPEDGALLETLRRERADFLNYKRRTEQDRARDRLDAESQIVERILPLLDELERALAQVPDNLREDPWVQGLALNHQRLIQTLNDLGIERIGEKGETFDPQHHEALFYDAEPGATEQQVKEVFRPGYQMRGVLVRPALVSVAGPPTDNQPETVPSEQPSSSESRTGE